MSRLLSLFIGFGVLAGAGCKGSAPATLVWIEVTPTNPSVPIGVVQQFTATGIYSDATTKDLTTQATWMSSDSAVATISSAGLGTGVAKGKVTVTATFGDKSRSTDLTVTDATLVSIAVTPSNPSIALGTTKQLKATGTYSDNTTEDLTAQATWVSSDEKIATVSNASGSQGLATSVAAGLATISATFGSKSGSTVLTVTSAKLVSIAVTPTNPSIALGTTQQLTATGRFDDNSTQDLTAQVTWTTSDDKIASIAGTSSSHGLATAVGKGKATIGAAFGGITGATDLTVTDATLVSIMVTPTNPSVALGTTRQLKATGTYTDKSMQDVTAQATWTSSDVMVATVSSASGSQGLATPVAQGKATINATIGTISGSTDITVTDAKLVSISVTPTNPSIALGTTQQLSATGTFDDNSTQDLTKQVTWTSSDEKVATVSSASGSEGFATSVAKGKVTISAAIGTITGWTDLTVTDAKLVSISVTPTNPSVALGTRKQLKATGTYTDNSTQDLTAQVTWSSSDVEIAMVSSASGSEGLVMTVAQGTATITAAFGKITGSTELTVSNAKLVSISVTPPDPSIALGTTQQFTATGRFDDSTTQDLTAQVTWTSSNDKIATVSSASGSEGLVTSVAPGIATISAAFGGSSDSATLTVTSATLVSISVTPESSSLAPGTNQQLRATGTYSDTSTQDLTSQAKWTSSDDEIATVSSDRAGLVTSVTPGTATISAAFGGRSGSATFTVTSAKLVSISVTPTDPTIKLGKAQRFTATGAFDDNTTQDLTTQVTWTSSDDTIATISSATGSEGLVTPVSQGPVTISAAFGNIDGKTNVTVISVPLLSIAVTPTNPSIALGTTQQFIATGSYGDGSKEDLTAQATWASSDTTVATVSSAGGSQGLAASVAQGTATISATFSGRSGSATLTVTSATLASIAVTPANPSIAPGTTQRFRATGTYTDNSTQDLTTQVIWTSSNEEVAAVSSTSGSEGLVTSVAPGTTIIGATFGDKTAATKLTVTSAILVSIAVTPTNPSIALGTTEQFKATGTFSDSSTQDLTAQGTWTSSDRSVATVSGASGSEGIATSVGQGTATISATLGGKTGSTTLTVTAATLVSIAVTPTTPSIALGTTKQFTATGTYTDNSTQDLTAEVTWASSDESVATVSSATGSEGLATSVGQGVAIIRATFGGKTGSAALTVTSATLVSISVTPTNPSIALGTTKQFKATGTYTDNTTHDLTSQATWASSDVGVATVSNAAGSQGLATSATEGAAIIRATFGGKTGSTTLTVTAATLVSIAVTPTNPSIALGTTKQFAVTGTYTDNTTQDLTTQVTWASSDEEIATISNAAGSQGLAAPVAPGTATISATFGDKTGSVILTVTPAALVSISVTPSNPSIALGTTKQFTATGTYTDNSTQDLTAQATWGSSERSVATVSSASGSQGLATSAAEGVVTISATFGGKTGSTELTVTAATLVSIIVTPTKPSIALGTTKQFTAIGVYTDHSTQDLTLVAAWASSDEEVATVSSASGSQGFATSVAPGSVTISAAFGGKTGSTDVTVTPATLLSIAVTPTNPMIAVGTTEQFIATGVYTDNTTQDLTAQATWTSFDSFVATVSNADGSHGLATSLHPGTAIITATFGDKTGWTMLAVKSANLVSIAVAPTNPSIALGTNKQFKATGTFDDGSTQDLTLLATWGSSDDKVAAISSASGSQGLATSLAPGWVTISAAFGGKTGSTILTVTPAALVSIAIQPANPSIALGSTARLKAIASYTDGSTQDVTTQASWTSSSSDIADVYPAGWEAGFVLSRAQGTTTITVWFGAKTASTTLTVTAATLLAITIRPTDPWITLGMTQQFRATGTYTDSSTQDLSAQVMWASSNSDVATISNAIGNQGLATSFALGTATISATLGDVSDSTTATVTSAKLVSIDVTPAEKSIPLGSAEVFTAIGTYDDDSTRDITSQVTWTSSDLNVASMSEVVRSENVVNSRSEGTAIISASFGGLSGSATVTVTPPALLGLSVEPPPMGFVGSTVQLRANGDYTDGSGRDLTEQVTWSSQDSSIATISNEPGSQGLATCLAAGTTSISATFGDTLTTVAQLMCEAPPP